MTETLQLYSYWRSSAAYRVRIGLNLKGLAHSIVPVHLLRDGGEQHSEAYRAFNPQELVPTLCHGQRHGRAVGEARGSPDRNAEHLADRATREAMRGCVDRQRGERPARRRQLVVMLVAVFVFGCGGFHLYTPQGY